MKSGESLPTFQRNLFSSSC